MTYSAKNYQDIARLIRTQVERATQAQARDDLMSVRGMIVSPEGGGGGLAFLRALAVDMATYFAYDNARFDRARFLNACGFAQDDTTD